MKCSVLILLLAITLANCGGGGNAIAPDQSTTIPENTMPARSTSPTALVSGQQIGIPYWPDGSTPSGGSGKTLDGVTCLLNESYHTHAHLSIIKDGEQLAIPAQIGLTGCAYELHTHDRSGIIHTETASYHRLTLSQFFSVWGYPLSKGNVAGISGKPVSVFVDDGSSLVLIDTEKWPDIELTNHLSVIVVLGSIPRQLPTFTWPTGL